MRRSPIADDADVEGGVRPCRIRLRFGRPNEQAVFRDGLKTGVDLGVELAHELVLERVRREFALEGAGRIQVGAWRRRQREVAGKLEDQEAVERLVAERQQVEGKREVADLARHRMAIELRCGADRGEQVADDAEVTHLLARDAIDTRLPFPEKPLLPGGQAFADAAFHRQSGIKILNQQAVFDLAGDVQRVDQLLAGIDRHCCSQLANSPGAARITWSDRLRARRFCRPYSAYGGGKSVSIVGSCSTDIRGCEPDPRPINFDMSGLVRQQGLLRPARRYRRPMCRPRPQDHPLCDLHPEVVVSRRGAPRQRRLAAGAFRVGTTAVDASDQHHLQRRHRRSLLRPGRHRRRRQKDFLVV